MIQFQKVKSKGYENYIKKIIKINNDPFIIAMAVRRE